MLSMTYKKDIRKLFYEQGLNISEISKETGVDRKTARLIINQTDFNELPEEKKTMGRPIKIRPYKEIIDGWLLEDRKARKKQRHTGKRVFDRLLKEFGDEFDCSYKTISNYVTARKNEIYRKDGCYLPLEHMAGEAQADFGEADFYENSKLHHGYYLNLSFPYSNQGYLQVFKGQNQECLFEGLLNIFRHIGGVPHRIWFDNASIIVSGILKGGNRNLTDDFIRFSEHHGFESAFCNPASGHEKGSVESKVGYHRRNLLVPVPRFRSIELFNEELLKECDKDAERQHYKKNELIENLHKEDKAAMLKLPEKSFEAAKYLSVKTNSYGKFSLNSGLHEYSTAPKYAGERVTIKLTAYEVIALDESLREIVTHTRLYGKERQQSMQWLPYLSQLSKKPGALKYTGIYGMLPEPLKDYMELCDRGDKGKILQVILKISSESGFENAVNTVSEALSLGAADPDSLLMIHTRLSTPELHLKPAKVPACIPELAKLKPNILAYDLLLETASDRSC